MELHAQTNESEFYDKVKSGDYNNNDDKCASCSSDGAAGSVGGEGDGPISAADKKVVTATWTKVYKDWNVTGQEFYIRFLNNQPDVKKTFKTFSTMTDDELTNSSTFAAHVLVVGTTINTWIEQIDDTDKLIALIQKLTDSHVIRGIKDKQLFKAVLDELLAYMSEKLKLTPAQVTSWTKVAGVICSVIEQRINDLK